MYNFRFKLAKARLKRKDISELSFLYKLLYGIILGYAFGYLIFYILPSELNKDAYTEELNFINDKQVQGNTNTIEAEHGEAFKKVRLLCWVMTQPENHYKKAIHVKHTWGKRCDILLFMSSQKDNALPAIKLPLYWEGRHTLWYKTKNAFSYIFKHYFEKADWFLKADDDTYVVVENLKYLLADQNTTEPVYYGWRFKHLVKQGFMSGGAGYVLSKMALKKFILEALPNVTKGNQSEFEDVAMGQCLENVGVKPINTRDSYGRERFFPTIPDFLLDTNGKIPDWYSKQAYYPPRKGSDCCSDAVISFHYATPDMMYVIEQILYHIKPYGISREMRNNSKR